MDASPLSLVGLGVCINFDVMPCIQFLVEGEVCMHRRSAPSTCLPHPCCNFVLRFLMSVSARMGRQPAGKRCSADSDEDAITGEELQDLFDYRARTGPETAV